MVLFNVIRRLKSTTVDAAFGLSALAILSISGYLCAAMARKRPGKMREWNLVSTLRFPIVIALSILISRLLQPHHYSGRFQTVGPIDPGMSTILAKPPSATDKVLSAQGSYALTVPRCPASMRSGICALKFLALFC